jgi:CubicO group peptidase (beta-lactamase class C family)
MSGLEETVDTQFAIASGTKGLTALTVMSLIQEGRLKPATTARSVLGEDLPLIDDEVTVEHLLAYRAGIGDYVDEEADHGVTDHVLTVPPHELATTEQYCGCSPDTRASSPRTNGSPTATAAMWCSH